MKKKPIPLNPSHAPGSRNLVCLYYEACLNYAAANYWKYWHCSECAYKDMVCEVDGVFTRLDYDSLEEVPDPRGMI